jgi:hypothetical protein
MPIVLARSHRFWASLAGFIANIDCFSLQALTLSGKKNSDHVGPSVDVVRVFLLISYLQYLDIVYQHDQEYWIIASCS